MNTQERPIYFYMANLWSEVEKIYIHKERGDHAAMISALNRSMPIIERIKKSSDKSASSEATILEDVLIDVTSPNRKYSVSRSEMSAYLRPFASRLSPAF